MAPGSLLADPVSAVSLSLGLLFGTAGLPHIMMRFFTVPNAKEARKSVFVASGFIGFFFLVVAVLGLAAITIVGTDPQFYEGGKIGGKIIGGGNMPVMHLAKALGGDLFLGFLSAVAFATILAVVSGLALAGASAISHDIYARVIRKGKATEKEEMRVSKFASLALGVVAVVLGILFEKQNVAFLVGLTFGIAASANFPVLILSMYWKGLTTRGALLGGVTGLVSAVVLVVLSKAVWVVVLENPAPIFPYEQPALFSMTLAFLVTIVVSKLDNSASAAKERERVRRPERPLADRHRRRCGGQPLIVGQREPGNTSLTPARRRYATDLTISSVDLLGVTEQHHRVGPEEQLVLHPGIAGRHRALDEQHRLGLLHVQDRHAVDRRGRVGLGGGVGHVVGSDHEGHVGLTEVAVDLLQLQHLVIRHVGLGQQDVHVAGHAAGDGMDGVADIDALVLQQVGHLAQRMLRLGHRHAVAGHDDDGRRVLHDERGILRRTRLDRAVSRRPAGGSRRRSRRRSRPG